MSDMMSWAEEELKRYGDTFYGDEMNKAVLEVLQTLVDQNHSGMSAHVVISLVDRLWSWKPLTPLTGEDDEWTDESDPKGNTWQNKRYTAVFKNKNTGECYDINGRYFEEPDNDLPFRCRESRVAIEFPYMPKDKVPIYKLKYKPDDVPIAEALEKGLYKIL